jgi:hypothetical protein
VPPITCLTAHPSWLKMEARRPVRLSITFTPRSDEPRSSYEVNKSPGMVRPLCLGDVVVIGIGICRVIGFMKYVHVVSLCYYFTTWVLTAAFVGFFQIYIAIIQLLMFTYHAGTGRYAHLYYIATHFPHEAEWSPQRPVTESIICMIQLFFSALSSPQIT